MLAIEEALGPLRPERALDGLEGGLRLEELLLALREPLSTPVQPPEEPDPEPPVTGHGADPRHAAI